jgi:hypothetical protein
VRKLRWVFIFLSTILIIYIWMDRPEEAKSFSNHPIKIEQQLHHAETRDSNNDKSILANEVYPTKIKIDGDKADVAIEPVGIDQEGKMDVVDRPEVLSWYDTRGYAVKNLLVAGHRDWNDKLGVLYKMENWQKGKEVTIHFSDGSKRIFLLESIESYKPDEVPDNVMSLTDGEPRVTFISCAGKFNEKEDGYELRVIATFKEKAYSEA